MRETAAVLGALLLADPVRAITCTADAAGNAICKAADPLMSKCNPANTCKCDPANAAGTKCPDATPYCDTVAPFKCKACAATAPKFTAPNVCAACAAPTPAYDASTNTCVENRVLCQKTLLVKCASTAGAGLLEDAAHCNACIITNINALQAATCTLSQMQNFCALAPAKAAPGPTPVPEKNVCSYNDLQSMWEKWDAYCKLPGPKAAATPSGCKTLVSSTDPTDPMKNAVADCETQTGDHCYTFDLDGSRCLGRGDEDIFNCRDVPDLLSRASTPKNQNWKSYCEASLPKSYAMTEQCSKGGWDNSGAINQKAAITVCETGSAACEGEVGGWIAVCTVGNIAYSLDKCNKAKKSKCQCAPYDIDGAKCTKGPSGFHQGHAQAVAPAPHHHHHHSHGHGHGHKHHKHHYEAWDADEEGKVRAEHGGTASAYSYLPVACVAVAVLAGVAFVVRRRRQTISELPAAQAAGYGTVPP